LTAIDRRGADNRRHRLIEPLCFPNVRDVLQKSELDKDPHSVAGIPSDEIRRVRNEKVAHRGLEGLVIVEVEHDLNVWMLGLERVDELFHGLSLGRVRSIGVDHQFPRRCRRRDGRKRGRTD